MVQATAVIQVQDVMDTEVETIAPSGTAKSAAELMARTGLAHLIVIDDDRHVLGVVSERDILRLMIDSTGEPQPDDQWSHPVAELIRKGVITVSDQDALSEARLTLANEHIGCLPVVDENQLLVGVLYVNKLLKRQTAAPTSEIEQAFQFFRPNMHGRPQFPAFFRRTNGSLVLPVDSLGHYDESLKYARLGFHAPSGRILVKLVSKPTDGDLKMTREKKGRDGDFLIIPSSDFVSHFQISFHAKAYDITCNQDLFVLTPRQ